MLSFLCVKFKNLELKFRITHQKESLQIISSSSSSSSLIVNSAVVRVKSTHLPPSLPPPSLFLSVSVSVCERQGGAHNQKGEEEALFINKNGEEIFEKGDDEDEGEEEEEQRQEQREDDEAKANECGIKKARE